MVDPERLELSTSCMSYRHSNQVELWVPRFKYNESKLEVKKRKNSLQICLFIAIYNDSENEKITKGHQCLQRPT